LATKWTTNEAMLITGDLKSKIDAVWNDFWSGGISNPLEVMEQLTYLLFIKGLDEQRHRRDSHRRRRVKQYPEADEKRSHAHHLTRLDRRRLGRSRLRAYKNRAGIAPTVGGVKDVHSVGVCAEPGC